MLGHVLIRNGTHLVSARLKKNTSKTMTKNISRMLIHMQ